MGADQQIDWAGAAASALDWWHDAGVDTLVDDLPRQWLVPEPRPDHRAPAVPTAAQPAAMPEDWPAFAVWRIGEDAPDAALPGARIAAQGPLDAALMVLVDVPDREDCAAGRLLTGAQGVLFDRMLAAIGLTRDAVHLASLCCARPGTGRITADLARQLDAVARHHVALVGAPRLLLMGDAASRAVLATGCAQARGRLHPLNHKNAQAVAVTTFHPRMLLSDPARKADAWRDLQLLMGTKS